MKIKSFGLASSFGLTGLFLIIGVCMCSIYFKREGFSLIGHYNPFRRNFKSCRKQGYTKEFCLTTPAAHDFPGTCLCPNGRRGRFLVGYRGQCVCDGGDYYVGY